METLLRWQLQFRVWRCRHMEEWCKAGGKAAQEKRHKAQIKLAAIAPAPIRNPEQ